MSRVNRILVTAGAILFWLGIIALVASAGIHYFGPSTAPPAAAPTPPPRGTAAAPAAVEQRPEALPTALPGEATAGVGGSGEITATPAATTSPVASAAPVSSASSDGLPVSQARPEQPGQISGVQVYAYALAASNSFDWAAQAVPVATCESTNGADRIKHEANGTVSYGLWMTNSVWAYRFDVERAEHDDLYAAQITYELWLDDGTWDYWSEVCRP